MTIAQRTMTLDEFLALPEEKPALEYDDGVITQKMSPGWDHAIVQFEVAATVNAVGKPGRLAYAFPELRATDRPANRSLVPDVSVYVWERIERDRDARQRGAFIPPDIAIEIASPGQSRRALLARCRRFVERGARAALLLDPRTETIVEVRPGGVERRLRGDDPCDLADIVAGLVLVPGALFAALKFA